MRMFYLVALFLPLVVLPESWSQQLSCNPCAHGFGRVQVGTSVSFFVRLSNTGTKSLRISSKSKQGREFHFGSFPLPITLMPGKSIKLPIIFKPTLLGHVTGAFILDSNAMDSVLSIPVAGTGAPVLNVSPSSLNFGNVTVGNSATLPATLTASDGNVTVSSDQFTDSEFSIAGVTLPLTISSGTSVPVKFKFTPGQAGTASGKAGLFSNAVASPAVELLTGNGVAQTAHNVTLTWQDSSSGVVGYNIYRGAVHGGPYQKINNALEAATNYVDYFVSSGQSYYYVTTAVSATGQESSYSNECKATIPSP